MPCQDSSSSITFRIDPDERFVKFDFAKITCGREITATTGYQEYLKGKSLPEILNLTYEQVVKDLARTDEETLFILYLEWDCLRSAIAQFLGIDDERLDSERCKITSVEYDETGTDIAQVVFPPKELPKILPCSLADKN